MAGNKSAAAPKDPRASVEKTKPEVIGDSTTMAPKGDEEILPGANTAPEEPRASVEKAEQEVVGDNASTTAPEGDEEILPGAKNSAPTHLLITSRSEGFRRAGRAWSTALQRVAIDDFTVAQIEALAREPMLDVVCEFVESED